MSTVNINNMVATWNDPATNFRAIRMNAVNTASGAGSLLLELLVNGASRLTLNRDGVLFASGQVQSPGFAISGGGGVNLSATGVGIASDQTLRFSSTTSAGGAADVLLRREAADTLGLRNGLNPQNFLVYNTFTDNSNWERGTVGWVANVFELASTRQGTGVLRPLRMRCGDTVGVLSTSGWSVSGEVSSSNGHFRNPGFTRIHLSGSDGVVTLFNNGLTDFDRLQFGGTTSAFPAIRRNGSGLDFMLADVSAFCDIRIRDRISFGANADSPRIKRTGAFIDVIPVSNEALFAKLRVGTLGIEADCDITRDGADQIAMRRGTNPQSFRVYNNWTNVSNYERGNLYWNSDTFEVATEHLGTGVARNLRLRAGTGTATLTTGGELQVQSTVSSFTGQFRNSNSGTRIHCTDTNGVVLLLNHSQNDFNRLQFGGTTNAFPAIKRNGNRLDARLADDSAFCGIGTSGLQFPEHAVTLSSAANYLRVISSDGSAFRDIRANAFALHDDTFLEREGSGIMALRRATNAQAFRVYRTFTDTNNYERGSISWTSFAMQIGTERAGTGLDRGLNLATNGTTRLAIGGTGDLSATVTSYSCTSTGQAWMYATTIGFETGDNTIFNHATTGATLRMEHGNRIFHPTDAEWSLGSWPVGRWNSGYIDNLYLHQNVTSLTDWEQGAIAWANNELRLSTTKSGIGAVRPITFHTNGLERLRISADGRLDYNVISTSGAPNPAIELSAYAINGDQGYFNVSAYDHSTDEFPYAALTVNPEEGVILQNGTGTITVSNGIVSFMNLSYNGSQLTPPDSTKEIGWVATNNYRPFASAFINNLFLHNSYTNSSNWERGTLRWTANALELVTERLGTGAARPIIFRTNTVNRFMIGAAGTITAALTASQNFIITGLPTTNPNVAGALWNDGGTLRVSAG